MRFLLFNFISSTVSRPPSASFLLSGMLPEVTWCQIGRIDCWRNGNDILFSHKLRHKKFWKSSEPFENILVCHFSLSIHFLKVSVAVLPNMKQKFMFVLCFNFAFCEKLPDGNNRTSQMALQYTSVA